MENLSPCPKCSRQAADFTIINGECGSCRAEVRRDAAKAAQIEARAASLNDIRGRRNILLQRTDWTQLPDVSNETKASWQSLRQELRDITQAEVFTDALTRLDEIENHLAEAS